MNEATIRSLIFLAGAAAGGLCGYLLAKRKYQEEAAQDMAETRAYYRDKYERVADETRKDVKKADEAYKMAKKNVESIIERYGYSYSSDMAEEMHPEDEDEELEGQIESARIAEERRKAGEPYLITEEEFEGEDEGWDYVTLMYYRGDNTLVDKYTEEVMAATHELIGKDAIKTLMRHNGVGTGGDVIEPEVFVRNPKLRINYDIIAINDSYYKEED